ncbi:MAG TPA: ankyrin repeat domain-containing protein, partial [Vicinamibacterales bacterium]
LDRGADPNRSGVGGTTALMWAVPNLEKVRLLVGHGANVNARSETDRTAFLVAASYPRTLDVLRLLLDRGADLRAQDRSGATALALAVRSADIDVVRFLVEKGLDPNALTVGARRAGVLRNDLLTARYLISKAPSPAQELLGFAATWQPTDLVTQWIELGAEVNAANAAQYSRTPLMNAVTSEAEGAETLKLLLDKGANPNAETTEGERPLDWAIYKGDKAKIQVLEQYGATRGRGPRGEEITPPAPGGISDARVSLTRSLSRLTEVAPKFRDQATCISCHHNAMPALAAATARRKGIEVDEVRAKKNLNDILTFFTSAVPRMTMGDPAVGGEAITTGYAQMALLAEGHPLDVTTGVMTHWLMARQMPDGRWLGNGLNRPPSEYSLITHTAIAAGGLKSYPLPGRKSEVEVSLRLARRWLLAAQPKSAEERAMRLMGLVWTDASRAQVADAIKAVRDQQEAGGGWSQFGRTPPDAYATGLSLYALHMAGIAATDDTYKKGVAFLLATQYQDGTWLVRTHSFPVQRYFESGFPYGRHQWISTAGTSWASLAIAQTLPDTR